MDVNFVVLKGRVVKDATYTVTKNGGTICEWRLAVALSPKLTEYHVCKLWGDKAEDLAPRLTKGVPVLVEGALRAQGYEKDGQKRTSSWISAGRVMLLDGSHRSPVPALEDMGMGTGGGDDGAPW